MPIGLLVGHFAFGSTRLGLRVADLLFGTL
jgi:hypothetical protein